MSVRWGRLIVPVVVFYSATLVASQLVFLRLTLYESKGRAAVDTSHITLANLSTVFSDSYYQGALLQTLSFGATVVLACIVLGYPLSYVIARSGRSGSLLLSVVVVSSFTGVVIRALGWRILLGDTGPLNWVFVSLGLVPHPIRLVNNMTGAIIGTTHAVLPYMVLLLVPLIEGIDPSLEQAAAGLGASWWRTFRLVIFPLTLPGLIGGSLLVFATTMGSFTTPALLAGNAPILPVVIRQQISTTLNYPLGAALSLVLLVLVLAVVFATNRLTSRLLAQ